MHIVIVGGGAGGFELAVALSKNHAGDDQLHVTLIDQTLSHIWKPLLHDVASGTLNNIYDEISYLDIAQKRGFHFQLGKLTQIDRKNKKIVIHNPIDNNEKNTLSIQYDYLVLAIGSITNNFNTPGSEQFCYYLDSENEAKKLHRDLLQKLIHAEYEKRTDAIKMVIVGGGATGVELAAELHHALSQLHNIVSKDPLQTPVDITIIEAASRILSPLPERISSVTDQTLKKMGIRIITSTRVTEVKADGVQTEHNEFISADMIVWSAGVKGQKNVSQLADFEFNSIGQIRVKSTLQTTIDDSIFAFGDCACCLMSDGKPVPARAQAAHQQATLLTKTFHHLLYQKPLPEYQYVDYGSLVSLSHNGTVGALLGKHDRGVFIQGFFARMIYLLLYKSHQIKILGWWKVGVMTIANFLTRRVRSPMKLH